LFTYLISLLLLSVSCCYIKEIFRVVSHRIKLDLSHVEKYTNCFKSKTLEQLAIR
jgi:hypothetical protein